MLTGAVEIVSSGRDPAAVNRKIEPVMRKLYSGFRPGPTQTGLYNHIRWLEA